MATSPNPKVNNLTAVELRRLADKLEDGVKHLSLFTRFTAALLCRKYRTLAETLDKQDGR